MKIENEFGYCEYGFEHDSLGEYVHIFNLFVCKEFRKNGHAKRLINEAIDKIRETGYLGKIQIVANPSDNSISKEKLIAFYKSLGLEVFESYCQISTKTTP